MPFFRGGPKRAPRGGGMDRQDGLGARLASWPLARMASRARILNGCGIPSGRFAGARTFLNPRQRLSVGCFFCRNRFSAILQSKERLII